MVDFDIALNIRDVNGALVLALEDDANGYYVRGGGLPAHDRIPIGDEYRSPWVDGAADGIQTLDRTEVSILVKVFGSSWPQVEARRIALENALPLGEWQLEEVVEGVSTTWRAGPAQVLVAPSTTADRLNKRRYVVLTFKVQPSPVVTGLEP